MRGAWRKQRLHSRPKFVGQSEAIIRHAPCRARLGLLHAQEMGTASQMSTVPILSGYALNRLFELAALPLAGVATDNSGTAELRHRPRGFSPLRRLALFVVAYVVETRHSASIAAFRACEFTGSRQVRRFRAGTCVAGEAPVPRLRCRAAQPAGASIN